MAYTDTWDAAFEASPADLDDTKEGAERIRDLKVAVRERLEIDHYFAIDGTDADHGEHIKVTLRILEEAPGNEADKGFIYTKDVGSGVIELFYLDADGNEVQLTSGGAPTGFASGTAMVFYQDSAPTGWTIDTDLNDKLLFVTKGSGASGETGGQAHTTGTWDLTGVNSGEVTLTAAQSGVPAHTHTLTCYGNTASNTPTYITMGHTTYTSNNFTTNANAGAAASEAHQHTMGEDDSWRPAAYNVIICTKD